MLKETKLFQQNMNDIHLHIHEYEYVNVAQIYEQ